MTLESILRTLSKERKPYETNYQVIIRLKNDAKIPDGELQNYRRIASAADYYDGNEWMHVQEAFQDPLQMVEFLRKDKQDESSLSYLTQALWTAGNIPNGELKKFQFTAGAADYYDRNEWMHVKKPFEDPLQMVEFLRKDKQDGSSLSYLAQALWTGGKIPNGKLEYYQFTAGAADYYDRNEWMHVQEAFQDPLQMVEFLRKDKQDGSSLSYLAQALWTAGKIPNGKLQSYQRTASTADYYDRNEWMHVKKPFEDPLQMVEFLRKDKQDGSSLSYLAQALWTGGKIPNGKLEYYQFTAGAADYYDRNEWMHVQEAFQDPLQMVEFLRKDKQDGSSLSYLAQALWTGGKIPNGKLQSYQRIAGAADYYDRNEWIYVQEAFQDPLQMVEFLRKDKQDESSLSYLTQALWTAGKIPDGELQSYQRTAGAADYALDKQEMIEEQLRRVYLKVDRSPNEFGFIDALKRKMDISLFTQKRDPTKEISDRYLKSVMRCAMNMYGNDIVRKQNV